MPIRDALIPEYEMELKNTRKMLERVPMEKADWKPHEKSMSLGRLAAHVAETPIWMTKAIIDDEIDFANGFENNNPATKEELIKLFDESAAKAMEELKKVSDESFLCNWVMRRGDRVYATMPKVIVARNFGMNHLYHHRGQLSVYLRLLDVPVPGMYGPSADEGR
ncbi:MAG: hypothetical protein E6H07_10815 [Bacteroidetes bacterium]|nr:MAG: hypothetical protein E6H07_10815 [Bacteroidota bacterium]